MLILVAHGSRDARWRDSVRALAGKVAQRLPDTSVKVAFMQFDGPTLPDVVERAAAEGHRNLTLLPLFVASAGHVDKDIKPLVAELARIHPNLELHLLTPVGEDELFPTFISNVFSRPSEPS